MRTLTADMVWCVCRAESAVSPRWVTLSCGLGAIMIGLCYPLADTYFSSQPHVQISASTLIRQLIIFVGLILASVKFPFENNVDMAWTLAFIALLVWWIGDRSKIGLAISLMHTLGGTFFVQSLALLGFYRYTDADFVGVRSWMPALIFAGSVACGNLARILCLDRASAGSALHTL